MTKEMRKSLIIMGVGFAFIIPTMWMPLRLQPPSSPWDWILPAISLGPGLMLLVIGSLFFGYSAAQHKVSQENERPNVD